MPRDIVSEPDVGISMVLWFLKRGKARIEEAWVQRNAILRMPGGYAYCMSGAVSHEPEVCYRNVDPACAHAEMMLNTAIALRTQRRGESVVQFNDYWNRRKEDCIEIYDLAITLQERKEQGLPI